MERVENPMVMCRECESEPKPLETCESCGCDLFSGDTAFKIGDDYYCEDCVEKCELEADDFFGRNGNEADI